MKKIALIAALFGITFGASAQSTSPFWGTSANQDNTYRNLTLGLKSLADTAGSTTDTLTFVAASAPARATAHAYYQAVKVTLTDSCVLSIKANGNAYFGDIMEVFIYNTSGSNHFVNFLGYSGLTTQWYMATTGTKISPASGTTAIVGFRFNGTLWQEIWRNVH